MKTTKPPVPLCVTVSLIMAGAYLAQAGPLVPITGLSSSNGGDRYGNGLGSLTNGSGIDKSADPSDPSAWVFSGSAYQDELMSWYFKDGDGLPTTGLNGKLAWDSLDLGSSTPLETLYLFNNNYQGGVSGVHTYNLYYADSPTVALPAAPNKDQFSNTGLTPQGDYDFSSGGWTLFNTSGVLTATKNAITTVDLTGVSARYLAIEILTNHGDTYKGGRVGLDEVAITAGTVAPTFTLTITPNGTNYNFSWDSQNGKVYDLVSSSDLSTPILDWDVYDDGVNPIYENILPSGTGTNMLENVVPTGPTRFFAVVEKDSPPLLSEDFELVTAPDPPADWSFDDNSAGTAWTVGTPTGATTEPDAAANGAQCAGTNIGGNYTGSAVASIITKAFTVPASGATLTFSQYIDTETAPSGDLGSIRLLNAGDNSVLVGGDVATDLEGITEAWSSETLPLPAVANGLSVKLEFRFESDGDGDLFAGFYIDDVVVTGN